MMSLEKFMPTWVKRVGLVTVILLLNFLSFLPSMVLGPIGEALQLAQHSGAAK